VSVFALNLTELFREMHVSLEFRILPWSTTKTEFIAASNKYEMQIRVWAGFESIWRGALRDAVALFTDALAFDHSSMHAFVGRAMAHEQMRDYEQAQKDYDRALQLDQGCVLALCRCGWTRLALNQTREAQENCSKAISLAPNQSAPHNNLGNTRTVTGNMAGALTEYNKAIRLAKSDREQASVLVNRGVLRYVQGLWKESAADLKKGIGLCEELSCWSHFLLWHCHARANDRSAGDAKLGDYLSSLEAKPKCENPAWIAALGGLLLGRMSEETTLSMLDTDETMQTRERYCEVRFHLGGLALLDGRLQIARKHFQECLNTNIIVAPEYVCAHAELSRLGDCCERTGTARNLNA
jgi:Tfp pilus assembly protein PilF